MKRKPRVCLTRFTGPSFDQVIRLTAPPGAGGCGLAPELDPITITFCPRGELCHRLAIDPVSEGARLNPSTASSSCRLSRTTGGAGRGVEQL